MVHVDDMLVTRDSAELIESFISRLNGVFSLKDLGEIHCFLSIEVTRDSAGILLNKRDYILSLLEKFNMSEA